MTQGGSPLDELLDVLVDQHEETAARGSATLTSALRRRARERHAIKAYAHMAETDRASATRTVERLRRHLRRVDSRAGGPLRPDQVPAAARTLLVHSLGVRDPLMDQVEAAFDDVEAARNRIPLRWWWRRARGKIPDDDPLLEAERDLERFEEAHAAVWRRWTERES